MLTMERNKRRKIVSDENKGAPCRGTLNIITKIDICLYGSRKLKCYASPVAPLLYHIYYHRGRNGGATIAREFVSHFVVIAVQYAISLEIESINNKCLLTLNLLIALVAGQVFAFFVLITSISSLAVCVESILEWRNVCDFLKTSLRRGKNDRPNTTCPIRCT
jgi:hypothetical protein